MDDIDKLFLEYTSKYDFPECRFKVEHSFRVKDFAMSIAESLNFSEEDKRLVYKASLLHDIGRFEQFKRYHNFRDRDNEYHGDIGVKVLLNNNLIDKFAENSFERKTILKVCKYHGTMDELGDSKKDTIIKIVRDSDKIDILNSALKGEIVLHIENANVSDYAKETFNNHTLLNLKEMATPADRFVVWLCFTFDFNFKYTFKYLKDTKLLDKLIIKYINKTDNQSTKDVYKDMGRVINKYIEEHI